MGDARRREGKVSDMTKAKFATDIPSAITMPDRVETRLGTLQFIDPSILRARPTVGFV